jgi:hypothetical protein
VCRTAAGELGLQIDDGKLRVSKGRPKGGTDLVMISEDPQLLVDWLTFQEALTNAIITGKPWISANQEFTTVFKLDRLPRSTLRDAK